MSASGITAPAVATRLGDAALLVTTGGPEATESLAAAVRRAEWPGVVDVVGGMSSVLVRVTPGVDLAELASGLAGLTARPSAPGSARTLVVPVSFDGPDLELVGRSSGLGAEGVVEELTTARLTVAMVGFSPGFAYLRGLSDALGSVPRRPTPRLSVPAGSVALAGGFAGVYPQSTPGGWQIVGRTTRRLFDPTSPPHAVLCPGDVVRFVRTEAPIATDPAGTSGRNPDRARDTVELSGASGRAARAPWPQGRGVRPGFVVEQPGLLSIVEDRGRPGLAHLGVPRAGPADPRSHLLANKLVGNPPGTAALEVTVRGPTLRCRVPTYVAVVGGAPIVTVDGLLVDHGRVIPVSPGQRLAIGATTSGARCYLAAAGGLVVPEVLGSSATDTLSWLGPGPLQPGDELGLGEPMGVLADHLAPGSLATSGVRHRAAHRRSVRVLAGPHVERFDTGSFDRLGAMRWSVDAASSRVGIRLVPVDTPGGLTAPVGELASHGVVDGVVQVPPDGHPIVLLPDHATLGGYPVIAVVISADLPLLGECAVGDEVELIPVSQNEAARALVAEDHATHAAVAGRYPVRTA